jgi:tRNA-dihydrouridine synthase C
MVNLQFPALVLAPMEGVTDPPMRALQGERGAFTFAVSEFLRVNQVVPSRRHIHRHVPELQNGARTLTGLPVQVQLLGGDPDRLAEAALAVHAAGATAVDINFGCPARTVNRHDGGATLLQHPKRIRDIVRAIRSALPVSIPVSAKLRLGWDSPAAIEENAAMAVEGGASWLTIHARTRAQGYAPPVDWKAIGRTRKQVGVPVIANGDICTISDFLRCREETGCSHYMLGRGALANPYLACQVAGELGIRHDQIAAPLAGPIDWLAHLQRLETWTEHFSKTKPRQSIFRMKQWLYFAAKFGDFPAFEQVKRARTIDELFAILLAAGQSRGRLA